MSAPPDPYRGRRFPREVIAHAVRLYLRFALSYRDVEELLAERGIVASYETVVTMPQRPPSNRTVRVSAPM